MSNERVYCSHPTYRNAVASLATSAFHLILETPEEDATEKQLGNYMKLVRLVEEQITRRAEMLSKEYNVPVLNVHADIHECSNFLPKHDLIQSYLIRKNKRLN